MVGEPRRFGAPHQRFQPLEVLAVERLNRAEVHGHAVLHDAVLLQNLVQYVQRAAAIDHEIFGDDFEPVDDRLLLQDVVVVRHPQPDPDAVLGETIEAVGWHNP